MIKQSFTLRILVISFLALALPLLVNSFIFFQNSYNDAIEDAKTDLREAADFRALTITEIQPVNQQMLKELVYFLDLENQFVDLDTGKLSKELAITVHVGGDFQVFILDAGKNGQYNIIASSQTSYIGGTFASNKQLEQIMKTGSGSFIRYIYSHQLERFIPYVFIARAIHSPSAQEPLGFIMAVANIETALNEVLAANVQETNISFAALTKDGVVFASTDPLLSRHYFDPLSSERREEIIVSHQMKTNALLSTPLPVIQGRDPPFFEFIFNDQIQIAYRTLVSDFGISVVAYSSKVEFFGSAIRHFLLIYSIYGVILVVGGGVTYWLSLWVSRPLRQLSHLIGEVSQGNLDVHFEKEPLGFEINLLGESFNTTLINLLANIQTAEDERVRKETYQRELAIGHQVQRSLLPTQVPKIVGAEVAAIYIPAQEVEGGFYGCGPRLAKTGEEILQISVAGAAGKGISSCLYSLSARSLLVAFGNIFDDPGEILYHTNNAFLKDTKDTGMFVTLFTGAYYIQSKTLTYYSCGHVPPVVRRADGHLETLEASETALGVKKSAGYTPHSIQLASGDCVIFYTNGLTKVFDEKHLYHRLQNGNWTTAQETIERLAEEVRALTGDIVQEEVIIIALKVD